MAHCSNELQMVEMWTAREIGGYSCHDLVRPNIRVTPERFLSDVMCACGPGHFGAGTNCSACPEDTFNDEMDQSECQACPQGGTAPTGSQALSACKCPYGAPGKLENETMCRCDRGEALSSDHECRPCGKLHLVCDAPGSLVATAPLQQGYIRLKEPSEEIFECLDRQHCRNSTCTQGLGCGWMDCVSRVKPTKHGIWLGQVLAETGDVHGSILCCFCLKFRGRAGPLCASCAQNYRTSKNVCVKCKNVKTLSCKIKWLESQNIRFPSPIHPKYRLPL